jgi:hypothetical protein
MEWQPGFADFNEGEFVIYMKHKHLPTFVQLFGEEVAPTSGPPLPDDISLSTRAESFRQEFFYLYD